MNPTDDQLNRLWAAVAAHPDEPPAPAYGLETRVLAAWRASRGVASAWDTGVLVRGLALAGVLMLISIWPALAERGANSDSENLQLADSTVPADIAP